ncbi:unnamed protein product [Oikopleura dioica]|uniref:Uncharacterized protein n=1 Tax=Oikopleura dioica TaxID=34765 RepID=E4WW45_OIKDI|nr:unnamed protein product [Oikopleura dioica]
MVYLLKKYPFYMFRIYIFEQNIECDDEITRSCQELFNISPIDCIDYCSGAKSMPGGCLKHSVGNSAVQEKCNYAQFAILKNNKTRCRCSINCTRQRKDLAILIRL